MDDLRTFNVFDILQTVEFGDGFTFKQQPNGRVLITCSGGSSGGGGGVELTAQEDTVLKWHDNCSMLTVTPSGALTADASGWPEGQQLFVRLVLSGDATVPETVRLIGYEALQNASTYHATAYNVGGKIYLTPIVREGDDA